MWPSPLKQWAPIPDTVCPSPAAGGSTSLGHPGPGPLVPSNRYHCWGLSAPPGPNIPKPWGRGAAQREWWMNQNFSHQLYIYTSESLAVEQSYQIEWKCCISPNMQPCLTSLVSVVNQTLISTQIPGHGVLWTVFGTINSLLRVKKVFLACFLLLLFEITPLVSFKNLS